MSPVRRDGQQGMRWNPWLLAATVVALLLIWGQSALPVSGSAKESGWLLQTVVNPVLEFFGMEDMSQRLLRKLAHVSEFALFSFFLALLLRGRMVQTLATGFVAAALDESIQLFSDRSAEVADIWIDFIGVLIGTLLGALLLRLRNRRTAQTRGSQRMRHR